MSKNDIIYTRQLNISMNTYAESCIVWMEFQHSSKMPMEIDQYLVENDVTFK